MSSTGMACSCVAACKRVPRPQGLRHSWTCLTKQLLTDPLLSLLVCSVYRLCCVFAAGVSP